MKNIFGSKANILIGLVALAILLIPVFVKSQYVIHIITLIFIWGLIATAWSYMGRFGLVSLGNGAFMGIGAYVSVLLFNNSHLSPWIGMVVGGIAAVIIVGFLGYACFRSGVVGDYFGLVTLALAEVTALAIVALREWTAGELGTSVISLGTTSLWYLQSDQKLLFFYIAFVFMAGGLYLWKIIDDSKMKRALAAIGENETAAAALGINVVKYKMLITMISAFVTAIGGSLYAQYITYINPHTVSGVAISLSIPFKAIIGGMFTMLGPVIGSGIIVILEEFFRIVVGAEFVSISQIIFGVALISLIIFLPKGLYGTLKERRESKIDKQRKRAFREKSME
ncbi:MAG: branched-chain amino acid ABC transporter permease [Syntrophales bacterium]|jgi:branched-chain amino acid transport system permease protein|nr:branched-chain amino acid ABC transporter permease [Syntrophales bacterium]